MTAFMKLMISQREQEEALDDDPMHDYASNEIKEIEFCKKCPKVKPYCAPIFDPIMFKPFVDDTKLPKIFANNQISGVFFICL